MKIAYVWYTDWREDTRGGLTEGRSAAVPPDEPVPGAQEHENPIAKVVGRSGCGVLGLCVSLPALSADRALVSFDSRFDVGRLEPRDAKPTLAQRDGRAVLRLKQATARNGRESRSNLLKDRGPIQRRYLVVDVRNVGDGAVRVGLRADSPGDGGQSLSVQQISDVNPGERRALLLALDRKMPAKLAEKLFGMRGYPAQLHPDKGINPARIEQVRLFVSQPNRDHVIEVGEVCAGGQYEGKRWFTDDFDKLFPIIDRFGQYVHKDWPGKTKSEADLERRRNERRPI